MSNVIPIFRKDVNIIVKPTLQDIVLAECVEDFIDAKDLFNYFTHTPYELKKNDPYQEFVHLCRNNLGFAASVLIGKGDFELMPFQTVILKTLWHRTFPILLLTRGGGKTTLLAIYSLLRAILDQTSSWGHKIVVTSAAFRQAKQVMNNIDTLFQRSPLLQACSEYNNKGSCIKKNNDKWVMKFGNATITGLPMGDGETIRGERASIILCDEFASINEEIFNVVVRGFAAVKASPVENVRDRLNRRKMEERGIDTSEMQGGTFDNQIIRSGTASYDFNHYYATYAQFKKILENKLKGRGGDPEIQRVLGDMSPDFEIDYRKYAIVQMPYDSLPDGYMDMAVVNEGRLHMTQDEFDREYNAKFTTDSIGFFKASAIEGATAGPGDPNVFSVELSPSKGGYYVMGIDPARKKDDFALVILRVEPHCHKVVYAAKWEQKNFGVIVPEIRRLVNLFNITRIGIDSGGGGTAILDFLQTEEMIPEGEVPYWELDDKTNATGKKILDMINYMGTWLIQANYDMCADIEHKRLLFPGYLDPMEYGGLNNKDSDTAEEVMELITEMKRQLIKIEVTATDKKEVEHFDLPADIKWKSKKDLYSALLMAAYEARDSKIVEAKKPKWTDDCIGGAIEEFLE